MEHPDVDTAPPSVTITPELQRAMARDLTRHLFSIWYRVGVVLLGLLSLFTLATGLLFGDLVLIVLALVGVGVGICIPGIFRYLARTGVALAYPSGAAVTADVTDAVLSSASALGTADVAFAAFSGVHVRPESVILGVHATGGLAAVLPRALFSDGDVERLRVGIRRTNAARRNAL